MHPRPVVRGRPNSAVLSLREPLHELPGIVSIVPMSPVGSRSVTSVMSPLTEDVTIIGPLDPRDPHDRLLLGLSEVVGMVTDRGIGPLRGSIAASADDLGLPVLLALRTLGIVGTAVPARGRGVSMRGRQISQCLDGLLEMCQRCRCLSWKKLIGTLHDVSLDQSLLTFPLATSSSTWKMPFATAVCA